MSLFDTVSEDIKTAMKSKDKDRLAALRAVKSSLLLLKTSGNTEITEAEEIQVLQKMVKQRKESAKIYAAENRPELFEKELIEAKIIEEYLPAQLSESEIEAVIKQIIERTGASGMKDMGKVIGISVKELAGKADGSAIAAKVKELLNS